MSGTLWSLHKTTHTGSEDQDVNKPRGAKWQPEADDKEIEN